MRLPTVLAVIAAVLPAAGPLPEGYEPPAPPGAFLRHDASAPSFATKQPLVATSYFYWYDANTGEHLLDGDGTDALTDHPPALAGFSYRNADWHAQQLTDMIDAGIDVALPVYWGVPGGGRQQWSNVGIPPLVEARRRLLAKGLRPPAIGMFYDTSTLLYNGLGVHVDLTTAAGRAWFYATVRDFFSLVPPEHRACIDGRPIVLLYAAAFAKNVDDGLLPDLRRRFRETFGCGLYVVKKPEWPGEADSVYQWGGALMPQLLDTAAIGPGYDHSAVPGREPLVRPRAGGRFYRWAWEKLLAMDPASRPAMVHVETWNELHEGTEVCETLEYGRQYIELTRRYADLFHARRRIEKPVAPPVPAVVSVAPCRLEGLRIVPQAAGDGAVEIHTRAGRVAFTTAPNRVSPENRYLYFDADDLFAHDANEPMVVTVGYLDDGAEAMAFEYDSADPNLSGLAQQFRPGWRQAIGGTKAWKQITFTIPHARFAGRANGCDFRLAAVGGDLTVSHVALRRP